MAEADAHSPAIENPATAAAVRAGRRRAGLGFLGGFAALTLAIVLISLASDRQDLLVREGVRVTGTVVGVNHPLRGPNSVDYRYAFGGREYAGHIGASEFYELGERVTVFVDPEQPGRSTLPDEQPQSGPVYWVTIFAVVLGFAGVGAGGWSLYLWRRRRRILRTSPWRRQSLRMEWLSRGRLRLVDGEQETSIRISKQQATRLNLPGSADAALRTARRGRRAVVSSIDHDELALGRIVEDAGVTPRSR